MKKLLLLLFLIPNLVMADETIDVRMPDGTILRNLPKDISKKEVLDIYNKQKAVDRKAVAEKKETYYKWKHITDDWYIETSSIKRKNGNIFVWQMINSEGIYKPTMTPVLSTSLLQEYDCSSRTLKTHAVRMYEKELGEGLMIANVKLHGEVNEVPADPVAQLIFKEVCGFLWFAK